MSGVVGRVVQATSQAARNKWDDGVVVAASIVTTSEQVGWGLLVADAEGFLHDAWSWEVCFVVTSDIAEAIADATGTAAF